MSLRWPEKLWIVRHGESAGNVARTAAHEAGLSDITIAERDMDVPLSETGRAQATALGRWFADMDAEARPQVVLSSPYLRARETAALIKAAGGLGHGALVECADERLREREFGIFDRLTHRGITERHPAQAELRSRLGKFYHRPPGGESWCDVILRLRSALDTLSLHHAGGRVLIVGHQVVVLCLRYLIEGLDEAQILAIDAQADVANCSITEYELDAGAAPTGQLRLARYNVIAPLERQGAPVTAAPDASVAPR